MNRKKAYNPIQDIGEKLKEARKAANLKQEDVAAAADLRIATISDIENGKVNFEINTLVKIANVLKKRIELSLE